jgi:hypothetical protein
MVPPRIPFFHVPAPQQVPRTERLTSQQLRVLAIGAGLTVITGIVRGALELRAASHEDRGDDSSSSTNEPAATDEPRKRAPLEQRTFVSFWAGTWPVIADVNGDATADYVIRTTKEIVAIDGRTKKRVWSLKPAVDFSRARLLRVDGQLVVMDRRDVIVYALRDGGAYFTTTLDSTISRVCVGPPPALRVQLRNHSMAAIDTMTGKVTTERWSASCTNADTDAPAGSDLGGLAASFDVFPPSVHALGPTALPNGADAAMSAVIAIPVSGGHVVVGRPRGGEIAQTVGLLANGKMVWQSTVETVQLEGTLLPMGFDGARLAVARRVDAGYELVVLDAKTGARTLSAALPERALTVTPSGDGRWLVVGASSFVRVDDKGVVENLLDE